MIPQRNVRSRWTWAATAAFGMGILLAPLVLRQPAAAENDALGPLVVLGYNELGMHCMNEDFSELCILPPYNTLRAVVIDRSLAEPEIIREGLTIRYTIPGNTHSTDKTNFWTYAPGLFGAPLPADRGLTGNGLSGTLSGTPHAWWEVTGIPITPLTDDGRLDTYQKARLTVIRNGLTVARGQPVVPVSWEISCNLCHNTAGISPATDILRRHDQAHGTTLEASKPVLCAKCHADPALGTTGTPGVPNLSAAMHGAHANRMTGAPVSVACYACHPGIRTKCQRDIHLTKGKDCTSCHGGMAEMGNPTRRPWQDEPRCSNCHTRSGFEFEQPGTLFKESLGHHGVPCAACHGSPHAITPTVSAADNVQAINVQGHPGPINTCSVCHSIPPDEPFDHRLTEG